MLSAPAPAKLNLFLHITGRRADGYHTLQTLFQLLDYGDQLHFAPRADGQLRLDSALSGIAADDNLVMRAARLLQSRARSLGQNPGADIHLDKRLPLGGGLGGGSSDAATTLLALNKLWRLDLPLDELAALGLGLGADVPVFVLGRSAWAEGVGEELRPVDLPETCYLVLAPPCEVSTARVFSTPELTRNTLPITIAAFRAEGGRNDCEPAVRNQYPEVAKALDWLNKFSPSRMTGSGACVFAAFADAEYAHAVLAQRPQGFQGFVARGVNHSPAHRALGYDGHPSSGFV
ncbi:MAG TPA: 4-(cytidine 5'-diphospho)-2-C-methyl-D-erythritol kinase [Spongiibacteraceae bacterium]|jgi:4-diphosphocytidyl-2-C-methyl-D-erythritol kinase|nr:4-(cytidine 5'-diphospho)-2-C-methyl-D-erythritol kinase [Spongiibacteraceae bacterium]HUH37673.1 4-(cytidine 5'-diphospho)-2-C-methyl-D-erythritol kinase [Spongiibacteraceae bacterium]